ncbi:MAG: aldo/keto reductase [Vampirovibrionales bacterium]|nr:aldo/keto reductase [Vampirovibrionales bacterium]
MQRRRLGNTPLTISLIGLGTMTWGEQNTEADAHAQLDKALACGINFVDTAELYAIPPRAHTFGKTEEYIGTWLAKTKRRDEIILATKIAGPGRKWIRGGQSRFNKAHLTEALESSLRRLQTDCVDLYQLHWPEREMNDFGVLGYGSASFFGGFGGVRYGVQPDRSQSSDPAGPVEQAQAFLAAEEWTPFEETLEVLQSFIQAGKIRHWGLSNESAWGAMKYLQLAEQHGWPKPVSIQNPYSLLNRSFESGLAEVSLRENLSLLAYSPLAFGLLSGKYRHGQRPQGRITQYPEMSRYNSPQAALAVEAYAAVADQFGFTLTQLALGFVNAQPFVGSNIIGATTLAQLDENIATESVVLSTECLEALEQIHQRFTYPCP